MKERRFGIYVNMRFSENMLKVIESDKNNKIYLKSSFMLDLIFHRVFPFAYF